MEYIDIDQVEIGIYKDGPIGIGVSGGADSAILLYILMSNVKHTIHIYNMWSTRRKFVFKKSFDSVIATCSKLTGNTNFVVHEIQAEPNESIEFYFNMLTDALDKKEVDIIYLGITKFPPKEVYLTFDQQQKDWHNDFRSSEVEHPLFGLTIDTKQSTDYGLTADQKSVDSLSLDSRTYIPWRNHNKQDVARMYKALDLESNLLPITRSCEDDDHPDSHCGKCWWCQERIWAFGYL